MLGHGLDFFIPASEHWCTLDNLEEVRLPPVADRPLLRAAPWLPFGRFVHPKALNYDIAFRLEAEGLR